MMSVERGNYYGLDAIGTEIWKRIEGEIRVADLLRDLAETFEGDPATMEADLCRFLSDLADQDLVEVTRP